jgi:hypothetical protein
MARTRAPANALTASKIEAATTSLLLEVGSSKARTRLSALQANDGKKKGAKMDDSDAKCAALSKGKKKNACQPCAASFGCGYCAVTKTCMAGDNAGPLGDTTCTGDHWASSILDCEDYKANAKVDPAKSYLDAAAANPEEVARVSSLFEAKATTTAAPVPGYDDDDEDDDEESSGNDLKSGSEFQSGSSGYGNGYGLKAGSESESGSGSKSGKISTSGAGEAASDKLEEDMTRLEDQVDAVEKVVRQLLKTIKGIQRKSDIPPLKSQMTETTETMKSCLVSAKI